MPDRHPRIRWSLLNAHRLERENRDLRLALTAVVGYQTTIELTARNDDERRIAATLKKLTARAVRRHLPPRSIRPGEPERNTP